MATVLGLAMKITADASGLEPSLSPVDKALASLGTKASDVASMFDKFLNSTTGAAEAQANVARQFEALNSALQNGELTAQEFAGAFAAVRQSAEETSRLFQEGASTTAKYRTETENVALEVERLSQQLKVGAIDQQTYERAVADVTGANQKAAEAEKAREQFLQRAAQLTQAVITPMEKYDATVQELRTHLEAGTITQQTYERSLEKAAEEYHKAESAAKGYDKAAESAGKGSALAFNELSGILAAIPGPIGNIAGRLSGLSSAAEGLGRIFSGGLSGGLSSLAGAATALLNPFTLAVAGVAAFGAAATAIGVGLQKLTGEVEQLQNTAARLGTSFEFAQVLEQAAINSGVSVDQLATGLQKFEVNISKARDGGNDAAKAFEKLGISQQELRTTDPTELAQRTAKAIGEIQDPAERARVATDLLGKSGLELLPAFAGIDDAGASLEKFRAKITEVDVERLASLDNVFDNIGVALKGLGTQLLVPFKGLAKGVAEALIEVVSGVTRFIDPILDALTPVFDFLGTALSGYATAWANFADTTGTYIGGFIQTVIRIRTVVGEAFTQTAEYVAKLLSSFGEFTGLGGIVSSVASAIAGAFNGLWQGIKNVVSQVGGFIEKVLKFAEDWLGIDRGVQQATKSYDEQRKIITDTTEEFEHKTKAEEKAAQKAEDAAQKAIEANRKIIDSLLEQQRIDEEFGGDSGRYKAAQNVEVVEKEIQRIKQDVEKARLNGDQQTVVAGVRELARLDQVQAKQADIASGAAAARKKAEDEQKRIDAEQQKRDEDRQKRLEDASKKIAEAQKKYIQESFELEAKRIDDLRKLRLGALEIGDLRTGAGSALFLDLASGKQDPAIDEYRKQRKELEKLNANVQALRVQKAEILGGVG